MFRKTSWPSHVSSKKKAYFEHGANMRAGLWYRLQISEDDFQVLRYQVSTEERSVVAKRARQHASHSGVARPADQDSLASQRAAAPWLPTSPSSSYRALRPVWCYHFHRPWGPWRPGDPVRRSGLDAFPERTRQALAHQEPLAALLIAEMPHLLLIVN